MDVVLFGEALVDVAPSGTTPGGAPFNVACHLGRLGFHPLLVTRVGADEAGREILRLARASGVATRGFQVDRRRPTARVRVRPGSRGPVFRIASRQTFDAIDARAARAVVARVRPRLLYFGTLAQRSAPSRAALEALLALGPPHTFLDVNLRAPWWNAGTLRRSLAAATTIKANEDELGTLAFTLGLGGSNTRLRAKALLAAFPCERLVVTRGSSGAVLFSRRRRSIAIQNVAGRPVPGPFKDSVGAGDAFSAVFITGLLLGWGPAVTLARANRFGAALCAVAGARPETDAFYEPFRRSMEAP